MDEPQAYLDGRWIPASAAAVSIVDAGFVLGATVAEQLRTFAGKLFRLEDHLRRLERSLKTVGVDPAVPLDQLAEVGQELVARNHPLLAPGDDLGLSIFVTPGAYPAYSAAPAASPTVCLHTYALPFRLWAEKYRRGQALLTTTGIRQVSPRSWPPDLKCRSRMHYYLADQRANTIEPGTRALLLDEEGFVSEASTANVLVVNKNEGLISPPLAKILPGISLAVTVELATGLGIPSSQRDLTPEAVGRADEVLLASTPLCLLPVTRVDGRPIGSGEPGEVFRRLLAAWNGLAAMDIVRQAERFSAREFDTPPIVT
jgi:branched-chain amino acid aminotransferase